MKARVIAYYLPQYHPIPENDDWWGKGFTEWTNVAKAKPLFRGHVQPRIPTELGFYDLRMPEVREQQALLAREAGIEGFCYWHYWFGNGKQLLERPFNEVLNSGKPDFPFCLGWANHTWSSKTWTKGKHKGTPSILVEQKYLGEEDYKEHFFSVLKAFKDKRYITVDRKPLFLIYDPLNFKDIKTFIGCWRKLAEENGLEGIHFVGIAHSASFRKDKNSKYNLFKANTASENYKYVLDLGFDAVNSHGMGRAGILAQGILKTYLTAFIKRVLHVKIVDKVKQADINKNLFCAEDTWENVYPTVVPNFDRTPRTDLDKIFINSTPDVFYNSVKECVNLISKKSEEHRIIFVKSWNEWGEGNYMEPDLQYGRGYIEAMKKALL